MKRPAESAAGLFVVGSCCSTVDRSTGSRGTTQRVLRLGACPQAYSTEFERLDPARAGACPYCPDRHRLRAHGSYERWVFVLDGQIAREERIRVKRFLCARSGQTVSLLPDFCLPRRRYGSEVVGLLLQVVSTVGASLTSAFARLRHELEGPRSAQALVAGFLARRPQLEGYAARLRQRAPALPAGLGAYRQEVARLFLPLRAGQRSGPAALRHHGRAFHDRFRQGIA